MITLAQLMTPPTEDQALQTLIDDLASLGFNARSWQTGSAQLTILRVFARAYSRASTAVANIAAGGFSSTAKGDWLTILSKALYDHDRYQALPARHLVALTCTPLAGPYTKGAGEITIATADGVTFRNVDPFTLPAGGSVSVEFEAEKPGAAGNVGVNTITVLKTALAGVAVNNPSGATGGSSITRDGAEEESDVQLHTRNTTKWATLGLPVPGAYVYHCRTADPAIKRVRVDATNPFGAGTLGLYLAGDSGEVSQVLIDAASNYLSGLVDGISRKGIYAEFRVLSARSREHVLTGTVYMSAAFNTAANQRAVIDSIAAYYRDAPIGGVGSTDATRGAIPAGDVYRAILSSTGVRNYAPLAPLADLTLERGEVAVPVFAFGFVGV